MEGKVSYASYQSYKDVSPIMTMEEFDYKNMQEIKNLKAKITDLERELKYCIRAANAEAKEVDRLNAVIKRMKGNSNG
jgi:hypothetical protein